MSQFAPILLICTRSVVIKNKYHVREGIKRSVIWIFKKEKKKNIILSLKLISCSTLILLSFGGMLPHHNFIIHSLLVLPFFAQSLKSFHPKDYRHIRRDRLMMIMSYRIELIPLWTCTPLEWSLSQAGSTKSSKRHGQQQQEHTLGK